MESLLIQTDNDPQALLSQLHAQRLEIQSQSERIQQLDWLKRQVFGRKSERIVVIPGQADLFPSEALAETPSVETETVTYERRKPKRTPPTEELAARAHRAGCRSRGQSLPVLPKGTPAHR